VTNAWDYIIVGAGTAGCVLANRLSANPDVTVLLIEAGPSDRHWHIRMPLGNIEALKATRFNWNYVTEPEPHLGNRRLGVPRGKVLGGSSSINGMVHMRGHPRDFDDWAAAGCIGWSYAELLPYFKKSERYGGRITAFRGSDGPLRIAPGRGDHPLDHAFIAAGVESGLVHNEDFNGASQAGIGIYDLSIERGCRVNAARAYLDPVRTRPNLAILTGAQVQRIDFDGVRATGVTLVQHGERRSVQARSETIIATGAVHSPQLLMLSGIGDPAQLRTHGIACRQSLPGVGANLQNHIDIYMQYRCRKKITLNRFSNPFRRTMAGIEWFLAHRGVCASNGFETGALLTALDGVDRPDAQIIFYPVAFQPSSFDFRPWHGYQFHVGTQKPESRGWVRLASEDPTAMPRILNNFLSADRDRAHMRAAMRRVRDIAHAPAFAAFHEAEAFPGIDIANDAALDEWLVQNADTAYHPTGTCRMGAPNDPNSVVDAYCRVLGIDALRVVDGSIMPEIVNCNPNAAIVAMAEKAADLIVMPPARMSDTKADGPKFARI